MLSKSMVCRAVARAHVVRDIEGAVNTARMALIPPASLYRNRSMRTRSVSFALQAVGCAKSECAATFAAQRHAVRCSQQHRSLTQDATANAAPFAGSVDNSTVPINQDQWQLSEAVSDSIFEAAGGQAVLGSMAASERARYLVEHHNWHPLVAHKVSDQFGSIGLLPCVSCSHPDFACNL